MIICPHCGKECSDDADFCRFCGKELTSFGVDGQIVCKHCGAKNSEDVDFCKMCGKRLNDKVEENIQPQQHFTQTVQPQATVSRQAPIQDTMVSLFVDEDEQKLDCLHSGVFSTYYQTGTVGNETCVLTNKRIYFSGKNWTLTNTAKQSKVIELENVTSAGITQIQYSIMAKVIPLVAFILFSILFVLSLSGLKSGGSSHFFNTKTVGGFTLFFGFAAFFALVDFIVALCMRKKAFEITFNGERLAFVARANVDELKRFQYAIMRARDNRINI